MKIVVRLLLCWLLSGIVALASVRAQSSKAAPHAQPTQANSSEIPEMPSETEIGELLSKASEYTSSYQSTFKASKHSLDKADNAGFDERAFTLAQQADEVISAIRKNGSSAYSLVALIGILDDMSLNASRASAATMVVALKEDRADPHNHAMSDFVDLAQAEKNCYDISELLLHATLRLIANEENALHVFVDHMKTK